MGSVKRGESRCRMEVEAHEVEGVRTNAICMILHVLARPGCAHRVSAFCLRFPLAFLAAASPGAGGWREGVASWKVTGQPERWEIIFLGFSRRAAWSKQRNINRKTGRKGQLLPF